MLGHTKRRHTSTKRRHTNARMPSRVTVKGERSMSVNETLKELCGDLPRWAIVLRGLRRREGLTQAVMGKLLGIPQGNISQMECGLRPIGKQIAKRLADLFETDYRLFL